MGHRYTTKTIISKIYEILGNSVGYKHVHYVTCNTPIILECPKHGQFEKLPCVILTTKSGCQKCGFESSRIKQALTQDEFIERAHSIHQNKYDYKAVVYINGHTRVEIKCLIHGIFSQLPYRHLQGTGCPDCGVIKRCGDKNIRWKGAGEIDGNYWGAVLRGAKSRNLSVTVTLQAAWKLFQLQNGRCALSGRAIDFKIPGRHKRSTATASLDRIDSNNGYVTGNVQWIHKDFQSLKMGRSEETFFEMCEEVVNYRLAK